MQGCGVRPPFPQFKKKSLMIHKKLRKDFAVDGHWFVRTPCSRSDCSQRATLYNKTALARGFLSSACKCVGTSLPGKTHPLRSFTCGMLPMMKATHVSSRPSLPGSNMATSPSDTRRQWASQPTVEDLGTRMSMTVSRRTWVRRPSLTSFVVSKFWSDSGSSQKRRAWDVGNAIKGRPVREAFNAKRLVLVRAPDSPVSRCRRQ